MAGIGIAALERRQSKPARSASTPVIPALRAQVLPPAEAAAIAGQWETLATRAGEDNPFFVPGVMLSEASHFGSGVRIAVVTAPEGELAALAPVTSVRLGHIAPAVRVWSHDYGPLGVPLIDRARIEAASAALIEQVALRTTLILPDLPLDGTVAAALIASARSAGRDVAIVDAHRRAAIFAGRQASDLRAILPARRRKEYGRQMRRLADEGEVTIDTATHPEAVAAALDEFLALEASGWKGKAGTAIAALPDKAAFAREALAACAATGAARIDALRLNGRPVAMVVSFIAGATAVTWKIAYDESLARFSPGAQLMLELPSRIFADDRVKRIDSLAAPHHPMIDHLWPDRIAIGTLIIAPPGFALPHRLGLAAFRAETQARAIARSLRDRLKRRG